MDNMVVLSMLVKNTIADELCQKGLAEIAIRRADAKFREMVKCPILGEETILDEVEKQIASAAMQYSIIETKNIEQVRSMIQGIEDSIGSRFDILDSSIKDISVQVDSIFRQNKTIQNLSYLNVGLSLVNIAVDVVGFVIINNKINIITTEVARIVDSVALVEQKIESISNIEKNKLISQSQKLVMRFNSVLTKIQDKDPFEMDLIEELLIDMKSYISEVISDLLDSSIDKEVALKIIYSLLPAYTLIFSEYTKMYYYTKVRKPANYDIFISLYDELLQKRFKDILSDYLFIENKIHNLEVFDSINAHILLCTNERIQIDDQMAVLELLKTKENVEKFELGLDDCVKTYIQEKIPDISEISGVSIKKCKEYFRKRVA